MAEAYSNDSQHHVWKHRHSDSWAPALGDCIRGLFFLFVTAVTIYPQSSACVEFHSHASIAIVSRPANAPTLLPSEGKNLKGFICIRAESCQNARRQSISTDHSPFMWTCYHLHGFFRGQRRNAGFLQLTSSQQSSQAHGLVGTHQSGQIRRWIETSGEAASLITHDEIALLTPHGTIGSEMANCPRFFLSATCP